jgi:glycerol kinase
MFLCIDQGGQTSRAMVFSRTGRLLAQAARSIATQRPQPLQVEHDPIQMLDSIREVVQEVTGPGGVPPADIRAAGLATQRSSLVCVDRITGEPLTPILSWQDRRAACWVARFSAAGDQVKARTGLPLTPHYGASKIAWCLENISQVRDRAAGGRLLAAPLASFLLHGLLQSRPWLVDPANASRTLLMNAATLRWDPMLLRLFGIPRAILPDIAPTCHDYGVLGNSAIPLRVSNGDQSAAVFARGEPVPGTAFVNIGTGAFIQTVSGATPVTDPALLSSIVAVRGNRCLYVLEGTVNGAGGAVELERQALGLTPEALRAQAPDWLHAVQPTLYYLNGIGGLGSPDWIADFPTRFVGDGSAAAKMVAVYESIVFLIQRNLARMGARLAMSRIVISGGLSRLDGLCQRIADLSELPVLRSRDEEATAIGIGVLLGMEPAHNDADMFKPLANPALQERHRKWSELMARSLAGRDGNERVR